MNATPASLQTILADYPKLAQLMHHCDTLPPVRTAIVHPCSADALIGAVQAAQMKLISAVIVAPLYKINALAEAEKIDLSPYEIVDVPHSHAAAATAVKLAAEGNVQALMKGSLHTDELMEAIIDKTAGLRTERRLSHVFVFDVPSYSKLLMISDAALNIAPDLMEKRDITQNAIDLAHVLGIAMPKVALLSAVETVNPKIPSTLDAAALCKMADRGQIKGAELDGPLAVDNAINLAAANTKGIVSKVAGEADILIAPNLETANALSKQLLYFAHAECAGIVLGAKVPVALTSRSDSVHTRLISAALLALYANAKKSLIENTFKAVV